MLSLYPGYPLFLLLSSLPPCFYSFFPPFFPSSLFSLFLPFFFIFLSVFLTPPFSPSLSSLSLSFCLPSSFFPPSFLSQTSIQTLLYTRHYARHWEYTGEQGRCGSCYAMRNTGDKVNKIRKISSECFEEIETSDRERLWGELFAHKDKGWDRLSSPFIPGQSRRPWSCYVADQEKNQGDGEISKARSCKVLVGVYNSP